MVWTLCTSGAAIAKAGAQADTIIVASGGTLANWSDEAENDVCNIARSNIIGNFSSLTTNGKEVAQKYCSASIAQNIITYDQSGYFAGETLMIMNLLETQKQEAARILKEDKNKTYLRIT